MRRATGPVTPLQQASRSRLSTWLRKPLAQVRIRRRARFDEIAQLAGDVDRAVQAAGPRQGPRVLVVQLKEGPVLAGISAVLAQALRLRGAEVGLLTCGGGQPVCEVGWARRTYPFPCDRCSFFTDSWARAQGIQTFRLRDGMPWGANAAKAPVDLPAGAPDGIDLAEATGTSVPRFFLAGNYHGLPLSDEVTRDFTVAAAGVHAAFEPIFDSFRPDVVVVHNGLTTSEYVVKEVAEARGARAVTYCSGFPAGSLMFSADEPAIKHKSQRPWQQQRDQPLTAAQSRLIRLYMESRFAGRGTYGHLYRDPRADGLREELDIADHDRVVTLFTNIAWDTATLGRDVGFHSMQSFVLEAVGAMPQHPRSALIVRIHPEEHTWGSAEPLQELLDQQFPELPPNVRIVGHDRSINSYALMDASDVVLTYTSTTGLEAALRGRPVAVCGDAHYRGKGFTTDVRDVEDLHAVLGNGAGATDAQIDLAWRYAFMFFFRMCIPFPAVDEPTPDALGPLPTTAAALAPGRDPYLDFVCDGILAGGGFVLPADLVAAAATTPDHETQLVHG
ncbi:MAG: hypothetical protein QOG77_441 [Solirubrobacteraceae bacterium]|nr:hypothetical protein [Solirubrobacteraceae bacterium]